jgi:hypothetical protein
MKKSVRGFAVVCVLMVFGLVFGSCGGGSAAKSDINGVWKSEKDGEIVKINLAGESKTVEFDGKVHAAVVEKEDDKTTVVKIDEGGKQTTLSFSKMWNDNGSDFTLVFLLPDGSRMDLTAQGKS